MKKFFFFLLGMGLLFMLPQCQQPAKPAPPSSPAAVVDPVKHGQYLVEIMGCNDCHSAKKMGPNGPEIIAETMLSGYPAERPVVKSDSKLIKDGFSMFYPDLAGAIGPWGTSFAANLTPDESGLGNWSFDHFKKAMTQGKAKGMDNGRMLLPPMPWVNYRNMKDDDLAAIFAYLKSIPPVKNIVPSPIPPI